jgi:hypothetical protein
MKNEIHIIYQNENLGGINDEKVELNIKPKYQEK